MVMSFLIQWYSQHEIDMSRYQLTQMAQQDLIKIRKFTLKRWDEEKSKSYLEKIRNTLDLIVDFPMIGKRCEKEVGEDVHCFLHESHAVYYIISKNIIVIMGVFHQSMIPAQHLRLNSKEG
jgi:toxin ParE1/3/4